MAKRASTSILLLLFVFLSIGTPLSAADFYLSNDGNDSHSGTSPATAWRTLEKLSAELRGSNGTWSTTIAPGDKVWFRRGDVFRGSIAFASYNNELITFGSYDTGAMPVIKGSALVGGWTVHSGHIWKATVPQRVYFLYADGAVQTLARAPNAGTWLLSSATTNSLTSADIASSGLDFTGANVCVREFDWRLNRQVVSSQSGSTVNWGGGMAAAGSGANFYFDNKLELLDVPGEWFYDEGSQTLYYYSNSDPNSMTMEAAVHLRGLAGADNRSGNTIRDLHFLHYADQAIRLTGASNDITIRDCVFENNFTAIFLGGDRALVTGNSISESHYEGAVLANMANSNISNNVIQGVGTRFGQHRPDFVGDFYSSGIWLINGRPGCTVANNHLADLGYNGIRFNGNGITLTRNQISNCLLNMDDGGAIYTFGSDSYNCTISQNIIDGVWGDKNGTSPGGIALGIYIDNYAHHITIHQNTVSNVPIGSGILINAGAHSCTISDNVVHKCWQGAAFFDWLPGRSVYGNTLTGNTLYANIAGGVPIMIASDDNNHDVLSASNNNFLCNPYGSAVAEYLWTSAQGFTLAQWRAATGLDAASQGSYYAWAPPADESFLVVNSTASAVTSLYTQTRDLNHQPVTSLTLQPFRSAVLVMDMSVLPVELLYFAGRAEAGAHLLNWATAAEEGASHFELERSRDGRSFEAIQVVPVRGAHSRYSAAHVAPGWATSYYRLRMHDLDGSSEFSHVVALGSASAGQGVAVFPTATPDQLTVTGAASFEVVDMAGRVVLPLRPTGAGPAVCSLGSLPAGLYTVRGLSEGGVPFVCRVMRQ